MVCYIVPLAATLSTFIGRKMTGRRGVQSFWLSIMLLGGAVFGLVDHAFNGELFMISSNVGADLALGGMITAGITATWGGLVLIKSDILAEHRKEGHAPSKGVNPLRV
jgi:hypothetical protein